MEISFMITNEISGLSKTKVNSAVLSKRSLLTTSSGNKSTMPINSPLITNRGINSLPKLNKGRSEIKQAYTPALPSRSRPIDFSSPGQSQMSKLFRGEIGEENKNEAKPEEEMKIPMFRTLDRNKKTFTKPPLPFERKDDNNISITDQKSESKNNTTMETTPEIKQIGVMRKLSRPEEEDKNQIRFGKFIF